MMAYPLIFSHDASIRGILDDSKTETRRVITGYQDGEFVPWPCNGQPNPQSKCRHQPPIGFHHFHWDNGFHHAHVRSPYGKADDELWVREAWRPWGWDDQRDKIEPYRRGWEACCYLVYRADGEEVIRKMPVETMDKWTEQLDDKGEIWWDRWRSPIHLPRWASRIVLRVEDIRPERLQDITEAGAVAEGCKAHQGWCHGRYLVTAREDFAMAWDHINKRRGFPWDSNPWVWRIQFRRLRP